jgi:tetratricopeptide (TPR) repeat protein
VATGLLYRAQTKLEAGDSDGARRDLDDAKAIRQKAFGATSPRIGEIVAAQGELAAATGDRERAVALYDEAGKLDPRLDLSARRVGVGVAVPLDAIPPLAANELLSIDRVGALAARVELLQAAAKPDEARALAAALRARYKANLDPAFGVGVASALLAAGDRTGAVEILSKCATALGNEPTRTALRVFGQLARTNSAQSAAAARAAIALHQAMPALERTDYDALWAISKGN